MMLPISSPIWNVFPLLKNFQFTYRLLAIEAVFTSAMAGILVKNIKHKQFIYLFCFLAIFSTILNWGNRRTIPQITNSILKQNIPLSTAAGEGLQPSAPQWVDSKQIWINVIPKQHLEVLSGSAIIKSSFHSSTLHEYSITANTQAYFRENTLYFPGWNLYLNGKKQNVVISKSNPPGVIEFKAQKGVYNVKLQFADTLVRSIAKIISLIAILFIAIYCLYLNMTSIILLFIKFYNKIKIHGIN